MKPRELAGYVRDTLLRELPHRAPTGLVRIGNPGRDSPLLVTCNFTLTVRRIVEALDGENVWLLVANSRGINVWCAAGGGHLTHHDVVSAIRTSRVGELVDHRTLVLPQLAATGIERRRITEATGWKALWGPARLEDLKAYLRRGCRAVKSDRVMRFPMWERLEMATMWVFPMTLIGAPLFGLAGGLRVGMTAAAVAALVVFAIFAALPWLRVSGSARWLTFAAAALLAAIFGAGVLSVLGASALRDYALVAGAAVLSMAVLSIDLAGTTPWYGSYINTLHNRPEIELVAERCTGAADCVQVCPRDVLAMNGRRRKVEIVRPENCIQCGACIVQCPADALRFRYGPTRVVEPETIRRTRMNMLGRRTVEVRPERAARALPARPLGEVPGGRDATCRAAPRPLAGASS